LLDLAERSDVERLVRTFYRQAAMDSLLGPVFAASIIDWNQHIETLVDFWCWQLFGQRGYVGNPLRAHEPAHGRTPFTAAHYERWVTLFVATIDDTFAGSTAELAKSRAIKMARSMRRLLGGDEDAGDVPIEVLWTSAPRAADPQGDIPSARVDLDQSRDHRVADELAVRREAEVHAIGPAVRPGETIGLQEAGEIDLLDRQ